ncbi:unnamed protein product [Cuscuta europaea]|uniref:BED-type domain-containing protein n=1 Tax=Cuscuta europaea TaxID=41803 RepID=A0A9P1E158_CUSEU|nr:unnamed protein product [Cuscuta europaea]
MDRPRYSVDMGNLERNRTKELARKRSRKGKSHIGSSSQSRHEFDTGYARRDEDAMTDEQLEQELHRHNSRFFQDQPRTIDEEELEDEDDDVEEVIPESHDDEEKEGGGSHDADQPASSQTGTKKSKSKLMANNFSKWKDPNTWNWTATCNWCKKNYSLGISGGYRSATRHLKSKHPVEYAKLGGGTGKQTQISRFANNQQAFGNFSYNDAQNLTGMTNLLVEENLPYLFSESLVFRDYAQTCLNPQYRGYSRKTVKKEISRLYGAKKVRLQFFLQTLMDVLLYVLTYGEILILIYIIWV